MNLILPNWHPVFVHFTIALFSVSVIMFVVSYFLKQGAIKSQTLIVANWNLWIGAAFTVITLIMGLYAYNTVAHDGPSHVQMTLHRDWAYITAASFLALLVWSILLKRKDSQPGLLFLVAALASFGVLSVTAFEGGEAVYRFGLGVKQLPKVTGKGHSHEHADGAKHDHHTPPKASANKGHDHSAHKHDDIGGDIKSELRKPKPAVKPVVKPAGTGHSHTDGHSHPDHKH